MGILDRLSPTAQFIEVIEWLDDSGNTMLYRFPVRDQEIKNGAQLIVRESQSAVFVHEGQIADVFGPGRYTIDGGNTPILSKLGAWKYGFNSPFKSEVYFVNTKQFTDLKWGTSNPVMMRDYGFRHGAPARVRHLFDSRRPIRASSSNRSPAPTRASSPKTSKANCDARW